MMRFRFKLLMMTVIIIALLLLSACDVNDLSSKRSYDVDDAYFSPATHKPKTHTIFNIQSGTNTYEYVFTFTSSCSVSLYEYTAEVKLYSLSNELLDSQSVTKSKSISANTEFSFDLVVSQETQITTASIEVTFQGKSYDNPGQRAQTHQVTFVNNNGTQNSTVLVEEGKAVATPSDPKKTNYLFSGWYLESSFVNKYDFSKTVTEDLTLYAKYEIDATTLTNKISKDLIKGIVKIYNKSYNTFLGIETSSSTSQGSGFCFKIQNGYYYVLTNCHVAMKNASYDKQKFTIEDYQGNTYEGYLYKNPNKSASAIAASYDLACLYFKPSSTNVKQLSISSNNAPAGADVISIGAPQGQSNFITYGKIIYYNKVSLSNTSKSLSNVTFDVICHNAYATGGSSGGPLLDANLNVIGVNYAATASISRTYAIPAEKIIEFLNIYVYN